MRKFLCERLLRVADFCNEHSYGEGRRKQWLFEFGYTLEEKAEKVYPPAQCRQYRFTLNTIDKR